MIGSAMTGERSTGDSREVPVLAAGTLVAFRYELGERIALGETAEIYRARDLSREGRYVMKLVRPSVLGEGGADAAFRLAQTADLLRAIEHPGLERLVADGWDEPSGARFLALEMPTGATLATLLCGEGSLSVPRALRIADAVLEVLDVMHRHRSLHLDLGPPSIFLPSEPAAFPVTLRNVGLHPVDERAGLPEAPAVPPAYLAPERRRGERCDARSDVYSVGAVLYRMLSGNVPPEGGIGEDVMSRLPAHPVPDGTIASVAARSLRPQVDERYASASEMRSALGFDPGGRVNSGRP
jgi:serine/threonine-protein kinase